MIEPMIDSTRSTRFLLAALVLAALLLAARTGLAIHHYSHDLAQPNTECEMCDLGHLSKSDLIHACTSHPGAVFEVLSATAVRAAVVVLAHTPYLPRAPPSTNS